MEGYEFQDDLWNGTEATIQCLTDGVWNVTRTPTCQRKGFLSFAMFFPSLLKNIRCDLMFNPVCQRRPTVVVIRTTGNLYVYITAYTL